MIPYYADDSVTLYHGDCLEVMDSLPANAAHTLVTDPPYFLPAAHYSVRSGSFRSLSDLSMLEHFFRDVFAGVTRILRDDGTGYIFCDGQSYPAFYAVGYNFFHRMRPLIWDKVNSINGYDWRHQHELIMYFTMPEAQRVATGDGDVIRERAVAINDRDHLAQKPVALFAKLAAKTCPLGGTIFEPFAGSGTALVAARLIGRKVIAVEAEERYCELSALRLSQDVLDLDEVAAS